MSERRPVGRPRKDVQQQDMSKLATHSSIASGNSNTLQQLGMQPIKVEANSSMENGPGIVLPSNLMIQNMTTAVQPQVAGLRQTDFYMATENRNKEYDDGNSGGGSQQEAKVPLAEHIKLDGEKDTPLLSDRAVSPMKGMESSSSLIKTQQQQQQQQQANVVGIIEQDTKPFSSGMSSGTFIPPPLLASMDTTTPNMVNPSSNESSTNLNPPVSAPPTKRRGRKKRSPVPHVLSEQPLPVKRRRGRPKGSGVKVGSIGRKSSIQRSRVPSYTRYANILPRPDLINKTSTLQGATGVQCEGNITATPQEQEGVANQEVVSAAPAAGGDMLGENSVTSQHPGGVSSKEVVMAAANSSAALSLGTRKVLYL